MGRAVTLSSLPAQSGAASRAPITAGDLKEFTAQFIRLAPGAALQDAVPVGADGYLFALTGRTRIAVGGQELPMENESFAAVREGRAFRVTASAQGPAELVYVLAQPSGASTHPGLSEDLAVIARDAAPTAYVADQKKMRTYFVSNEAAKSARAHAMIVGYEPDTFTAMHHHPNAESLFVMLSGRVQFVVNGEKKVLERGQAVYFGAHDKHALQCAEGADSASFLEFHIPGAFTTVKQ